MTVNGREREVPIDATVADLASERVKNSDAVARASLGVRDKAPYVKMARV